MKVSRPLGLLAVFAVTAVWAGEGSWSGYVSVEPRAFIDDALFPQQPAAGPSPSAVLAPEFRMAWNDGRDRVVVAPYFRWDADDAERTHSDFREAAWLGVRGPWSWQVGVGRVFWGVTESRHLVDIVNQTDWVEDIDEEDKLGQPMLMVQRWTASHGAFSVYLLPGFRERTFPAPDARLRGSFPVDAGRALYESGAGNHRLDWAARWFRATGPWDIGVSAFYGTGREPRLIAAAGPNTAPVMIPFYDVIRQVGLDLQHTRGAWLWKLEAIARGGNGKTFAAAVAGLEYTLFGIAGGGADLGLLVEYQYDGRSIDAPPTIYDDDYFLGFRVGLNDAQGSTLLGGAIVGEDGTFAVLEGQRRIGDTWRLELEARFFVDVDASSLYLAGFRNDSFVTLRLAKYL